MFLNKPKRLAGLSFCVTVVLMILLMQASPVLADTTPTPEIYPNGSTCSTAQGVTIFNIPSGGTAYYTTDGTNPTSTQHAYRLQRDLHRQPVGDDRGRQLQPLHRVEQYNLSLVLHQRLQFDPGAVHLSGRRQLHRQPDRDHRQHPNRDQRLLHHRRFQPGQQHTPHSLHRGLHREPVGDNPGCQLQLLHRVE